MSLFRGLWQRLEVSASRLPLRIAMGVGTGLVVGLGTYTFVYAGGASYMTNDPQACANCHVMQGHYDAWVKSSHRIVAVCNDCHTPKGLVGKYATKADNGFWHSFAFTTGDFPDPIQIKKHNLEIAEHSCMKCHQGIVEAISAHHGAQGELSCIRCHSGVGHPMPGLSTSSP